MCVGGVSFVKFAEMEEVSFYLGSPAVAGPEGSLGLFLQKVWVYSCLENLFSRE